MLMRRRLIVGTASAIPFMALSPGLLAQSFPDRPVRMLIPFTAGGGSELTARLLAQRMATALGQPVVVEARPGADGQVAAQEVMRARPDGYLLLAAAANALSYVPSVRKAPPYDPVADFTPISSFWLADFYLFVHSAVPARNVAELVQHLRAQPGKIACGSSTPMGILALFEFMANTGTSIVHVPYKGDAPALPDFASGRIQMMFTTAAVMLQHANEGKLRLLATTLPRRSALLPDVPTLAESGIPQIQAAAWGGVVGPAGMPRPVVDRLSTEIRNALGQSEVQQQMGKLGFTATGSTPEELSGFISHQLELWRRAVRDAKIAQDS